MNTYLLEIGLEEMPAQMILPAVLELEEMAHKTLEENNLQHTECRVYSTPRRLAILLKGLPCSQEDICQELKGPPASIAREINGDWSKAALGFASNNGINPENLEIRNFLGKDYIVAVFILQGRPVPEILSEKVSSWIHGLKFPKNMRWGKYQMRFIRPIRWVVSLWNNDELHIELEMVRSGRSTRGHRFLAPDPIDIVKVDDYEEELYQLYVIADYHQRKQNLKNQIEELGKVHNCRIKLDENLLHEVTNLVEWPTVMMGEFDSEYLELPEEVLVTSMAKHQRYFPVFSSSREGRKLLPRFVAVRNGNDEGLETVCRGNMRVLRARLSDARFFFEDDIKKELKEFQEQLDKVIFFQKRGSQRERVVRITELSSRLSDMLGNDECQKKRSMRIAEFCKFDLMTQMIYEFPELQGVMGEVYALRKGEDSTVCKGIREHYLPRTTGDNLPAELETIPVALADRIDMLSVAFSLDMVPTGSADPFSLRRMAQGVVQIVLGLRLRLSWNELAVNAVEVLMKQQEVVPDLNLLQAKLVDFLIQRERWYFQESKYRYDLIEALLQNRENNPVQRLELAEKLEPELTKPSFKKAVEAVVRAINISVKYEGEAENAFINIKAFEVSEEKLFSDILTSFRSYEDLPDDAFASDFLTNLYKLEPIITAFFQGVMVMAEDPVKRGNRLSLCRDLSKWTLSRIDLREIIFPGDEGRESPDES